MTISRSLIRNFVVGTGIATLMMVNPAAAQDRIEPSATVRVFETVDPVSGRLARWAVSQPAPAEVLRIQVELARAGFDPGVRSGLIDAPTRQALLDFQTARGLVICGCLSYETILALGIRPEIVPADEDRYADDVREPGYAPDVGEARYAGRSEVIVVVPGFFHHGFKHKHRHLPGVVVGHEPAVGAGQIQRRSPISVGVREIRPAPPPGGAIRMRPHSPIGRSRPPRPIP